MSILSDVLQGVSTTLATALGGPLAGAAVSMLGKSILGDENASEDSLVAAITNGSPEVLAKIKDTEANFKIEMAKIDYQTTKLDYDDKASARTREVAIQQAGRTSWEMIAIAIFTMASLPACLYLLFVVDMPQSAQNAIMILIGTISSMVSTVVAYYFGSSIGSKQKTDMMVK